MARSVTFAQMVTAVQSRGSYENSADITSTLIKEFLNEALAETWDILVGKWQDYYVTRSNLSVSANQDGITLPTDFYKLRKLEIVDSSSPTGYRRLRPHDLDSAHTFFTVTQKRYRYRLEGAKLYIAPIPTTAETLRLFYIPSCPVLASDSDTFDGVNGYEGLVIQLALKRCMDRQDESTGSVDQEIARLTARVRTAADSRDADEPFYLNSRGPGGTTRFTSGDEDGDW
jgi:hypothetical protein